ncbi:unnamed protein product [Macrosiphum euphorbiae]|uniref:HAT C-terminal dimerisation domain-containing protein n=1 Tax=Macrosiphum euphorbiae TaxID=13131 RepID=A0AAV0X407_9HEMI|nr:unnamed protein product [Macrosiphum euphorbiae]
MYFESIEKIADFYKIDNLQAEAESWYSFWQNKDCQDIDFIDLLNCNCTFFPNIAVALEIFLSLPATSCTAERSFSTLRRVETWLRSTMGDDRLNGICMLSVHREKVNSNKEKFIENALTTFGRECPRRLEFIFNEKERCIIIYYK